MNPSQPEPILRHTNDADRLHALQPLWNALQEHHSQVVPSLGGAAPRELAESWQRRLDKYERWLLEPETFFVIAERDGRPIGYAFVTVGSGYAAWQTGDKLAELETLSVLSEHRGKGVGAALLGAVWERLAELGVEDLAITAAKANVDSIRFYERQGFAQGFVVMYGKRPAAGEID